MTIVAAHPGAEMPADARRLLEILHHHVGRTRAISMIDLYERWRGERLPRNADGQPAVSVPSRSRRMRRLIDDLREVYGVPVASSSSAGYWIAENEKELHDVINEFRARGLKSLTTAARLKNIPLEREVAQLALDLAKEDG